MLTLDLLEEMAYGRAGLDLTPLVVPNLASWHAIRASVSPESEIHTLDAEIVSPYRWHFDAKMLSIVVGEWRIHVTPNGRRLRTQDRAMPFSCDEISEQLRGFQLSGVLLSGIQRQVHVLSEADADAYNDVQAIRQSGNRWKILSKCRK